MAEAYGAHLLHFYPSNILRQVLLSHCTVRKPTLTEGKQPGSHQLGTGRDGTEARLWTGFMQRLASNKESHHKDMLVVRKTEMLQESSDMLCSQSN